MSLKRSRLWFIAIWLLAAAFGQPSFAEHWVVSNVAGTGVAGRAGDGGAASACQLNQPYGIARGPDGALYVCDCENQLIRRVAPDGTISTFAGSGRAGYGGDGGPATQAKINEPYEVRFDRAGNVFFVEMGNNVVRRVDAKTGIISTVAGTGKPGFSGDGGPANSAQLNQPHSIQFDPHGDLFICDIGNNRIRKVDIASGVITTFAGTGGRGATPDGATIDGTPLNGPRAIDFDRAGNLWLALREGNAVYRLDLATRTIHHVAGTGKKGFTGNGGPALEATLSGPKGLSIGPDGNVYLADTESHSIRMVDVARGTIELVAGTGEKGDGPPGEASRCHFTRPHGIFVDADGSIFVGDTESNRVRVIRLMK
ncbi:MAG TPA: beta-propeller fold lactonase family protein [Tepidisphaeraceae bacterium]|jgi:sugar lactone lactonase YvrE|nr:beta-propeller fold lactonase family protein [Tepidisphaeraceae bacterium]